MRRATTVWAMITVALLTFGGCSKGTKGNKRETEAEVRSRIRKEEKAKIKETRIRAQERAKIIAEDEIKWIAKSEALAKGACACKDKACAEKQKAVMNAYVKSAQGVNIGKAAASKVAQNVVRAVKCFTLVLLKK